MSTSSFFVSSDVTSLSVVLLMILNCRLPDVNRVTLERNINVGIRPPAGKSLNHSDKGTRKIAFPRKTKVSVYK